MVLPVPGGPEKSADRPLPSDSLRPKPQRPRHGRAVTRRLQISRSCAIWSAGSTRSSHVRAQLDPPGEAPQLGAGLGARRVEDVLRLDPSVLPASPRREVGRGGERGVDLSGREAELARQADGLDSARLRPVAEPQPPVRGLLGLVRPGHGDLHEKSPGGPVLRPPPLVAQHEREAAEDRRASRRTASSWRRSGSSASSASKPARTRTAGCRKASRATSSAASAPANGAARRSPFTTRSGSPSSAAAAAASARFPLP